MKEKVTITNEKGETVKVDEKRKDEGNRQTKILSTRLVILKYLKGMQQKILKEEMEVRELHLPKNQKQGEQKTGVTPNG